MSIEKLSIYNLSLDLSDQIWNIVSDWDHFSKNTIGNQLVRSADSIPANISEGVGRYHLKEQKHFFYYARGSLFETKTFVLLAFKRKLIKPDEYSKIIIQIDTLGRRLNSFIKSVGQNIK